MINRRELLKLFSVGVVFPVDILVAVESITYQVNPVAVLYKGIKNIAPMNTIDHDAFLKVIEWCNETIDVRTIPIGIPVLESIGFLATKAKQIVWFDGSSEGMIRIMSEDDAKDYFDEDGKRYIIERSVI